LTSSPPNAPISHQLVWWWNGRIADRHGIGALTSDTSMLNFTSLTPPLANWKTIADISQGLIHYEASAGFNLTLADKITEVGEVGTFWTNAVYNLRTTVDAPSNAVASGDMLIIESATPWRIWLMLAAVLVSIGAFLATAIVERRFGRRSQAGPKTKKTRQRGQRDN